MSLWSVRSCYFRSVGAALGESHLRPCLALASRWLPGWFLPSSPTANCLDSTPGPPRPAHGWPSSIAPPASPLRHEGERPSRSAVAEDACPLIYNAPVVLECLLVIMRVTYTYRTIDKHRFSSHLNFGINRTEPGA